MSRVVDQGPIKTKDRRLAFIAALAGAAVIAVLLYFLLRSPAEVDLNDFESAGLKVERLEFDSLDGWDSDDHLAALQVFVRSCAGMVELPNDQPFNRREALGALAAKGYSLSGVISDWRASCEEAASIVSQDNASAES